MSTPLAIGAIAALAAAAGLHVANDNERLPSSGTDWRGERTSRLVGFSLNSSTKWLALE